MGSCGVEMVLEEAEKWTGRAIGDGGVCKECLDDGREMFLQRSLVDGKAWGCSSLCVW